MRTSTSFQATQHGAVVAAVADQVSNKRMAFLFMLNDIIFDLFT
jgi:hypothetical protein